MALNLNVPGVYTVEANSFPNSVVAVETAIPAFIGYTARADYQGKSVLLQPVEISSLNDYLTFFGALDPTAPPYPPTYLPPLGQNQPVYHLAKSAGAGDLSIGGVPYDLEPDPASIYYLYNSIRLFFMNGGGTAYVVSVGTFGKPAGKAKSAKDPLVNPNVKASDLLAGLAAVQDEQDPTMLVVPDVNLLSAADNQTVMQQMLAQCAATGRRIAVLDVQAGLEPDPQLWTKQISDFRTGIGMNSLNYGTAYFPFLKTTISQAGDVNFNNCGGAAELSKLLPEASSDPVQSILNAAIKPPATNAPTAAQTDAALAGASPTYANIRQAVLDRVNTLPPCGAMAGVMTAVDDAEGVWKAPANVSLSAVTDTTFKTSDSVQAQLNVDALTGKSINAIRMFTGKGVLVWGARTLDGNSGDWRYLNVRRTMIMIEQSIKLAAAAYVFEANDANTWSSVASSLTNFLTNLWSQGALAGPSPAVAFQVNVGLGTTMTPQDITDGRMNISVAVAITHPAEFIVVTYSQLQQQA